jgi:uncharacterized lipoprotein YajG
MKSPFLSLVAAVLLLTGCNQPAESDSVSGGGGPLRQSTIPTGPSTTLVSTGSPVSILSARGREEAVLVTLVCLQNGNRE